MIKKALLGLLTTLTLLSTANAYSLTAADEQLIQKVQTKLDSLITYERAKATKIHITINKIVDGLEGRSYAIIAALDSYLDRNLTSTHYDGIMSRGELTLLRQVTQTTTFRPFVILEYSDYECPFCQRHHNAETLNQVAAAFPNQVYLQFQHFPLVFHPHAEDAAIAAECVQHHFGDEKFVAYSHELLHSGTLTTDDLITHAKTIGVDTTTVKTCLTNQSTLTQVNDEMSYGRDTFGVRGTPSNIIINMRTGQWKRVSGAVPAQALIDALELLQ